VVSKEDLILSKLLWAKESLSERQLADVENLIRRKLFFRRYHHIECPIE